MLDSDFDHLMPPVPVRHDIIPEGHELGGPEEPDEAEDEDLLSDTWRGGMGAGN
ncbi:hypothetical protein DFH28DRAFT_1121821 [Melampsora americana]|nr:hypothetical protein DFH28DRAFT_1121821 [Melampsora americana]